MAITERKTKKPPTFPYHPKNRAKQLKKSWIENQKIKTRWKAQKKREGLTKQPDAQAEEEPGHHRDNNKADSDEDASPGHSPNDDRSPPPESVPTSNTPSHDKNSLRELRKLAYSSNSPRTQKGDSFQRKRASGNSPNDRGGKARDTPRRGRDKSQPNMKLRMNVLLEKIKRDFP